MSLKQGESKQFGQLLANHDLAVRGLTAELVGARSVKISRNGRFVGVWRKMLGSYDWYPAGYNLPQCRVPTPEEAVRYLFRTVSVA